MDQNDVFQMDGGAGATLSPRQIIAIIWAYRLPIVIVPLLVALAAGLYIKFVMPKIYRASATMLVAFKADDPTSGGDFAQLGNWSFIPTQIEFIQSPSTLMPVVEKLKLYELPNYTAGYTGDGSADSIRQFVVWHLKSKLFVNSGNASRFIYVSAEDENPVMAATLANAVTDAYVDAQMRQFLDPAKERLTRYSDQLESLRANIDAAQAKIAAFRKRTGLLNLGGSDLDSARLGDLESRLTQAMQQRQQAELQLVRVRKGDAAVLNSALVQSLKAQLQHREAKMVELRGSLGARHPDIVALQNETAELREQLNRETGVHVSSAEAELAAASAIESKLKAQIAEQRGQVMSVRNYQDEGASLLQELESATKVYQSALDAVERAQLATQMAVSTVNVVNRASPPSSPKNTRRKVFIAAFGLALMGTIGCCGLFELMHRRVRCKEDVENGLGTPVLVELRSPA